MPQKDQGLLEKGLQGLRSAADVATLLVAVPLNELLIWLFAPDGRQPLHDPYQYPWVKDLEANWEKMAAELETVLDLTAKDALPSMRDFLFYNSKSTETLGNWKLFIFRFYGHEFQENLERCPETAKLVSAVPNSVGMMFSVLNAKQNIYKHRGFLKGILRLHIGLKVPDEALCGFKVGGQTVHWKEGKSFMFDQCYMHEAWNESDGVRIVLLLDILRPLPYPLDRFNRWVVNKFGNSVVSQRMADMVEGWTRRAAKLLGR
ncbi:MAG: aspartyl/asparaginyl beta-hydroxylase domain-containing protein [Myxococcota bacterium]